MTSYLKTPIIISDSKFFAMEGGDFQLTCFVEIEEHSSVAYTAAFSHNGISLTTNDYMTVSTMSYEPGQRHKSHLNLTVHNSIKERDEGEYKCHIIDHFDNTNSAIAEINFVTEPNVEFTTQTPIVIEVEYKQQDKVPRKKQVVFSIDYIAYPSATIYIYNPKNEQISSDMDVMNRNKYDVVINEQMDNLKFKVKYPDINDYGDYQIVATTVGRNFTTSVKLVVSGELEDILNDFKIIKKKIAEKPIVEMENAYVLAGEEVHLTCRVLAHPEADITWTFQPCQDLSLWPTCRKEKAAVSFNSDLNACFFMSVVPKVCVARILSFLTSPDALGIIDCLVH